MRRSRTWLVGPAILLTAWGVACAAERLVLVEGGRPVCSIVHGQADDFAAERLARWLEERTGASVTVAAAGKESGGDGCLILIGSAASNTLLAKVAAEGGLDLDAGKLTEQGYVAKRLRHGGRDCLVLAGGGRDGALHAVVDLINWHLCHSGKDVWLGSLEARQVPRFKYRWLWTWDHRMDWGGPGKPGTVMGGGGTFAKRPEAFLIDYKRCVDYMADHKYNGLIIWGFVRDTHGGIEATQELCRYASRRGVRILPGVGTSGYAGYYFEGDHAFNAGTWLKKHPECRSVAKNGRPRNAPCPSKKATQDWLDDGAKWLFETFEVGGVNLEMGDFFVCYCDDCKKARSAIDSDEPDYYKDMAISHMVTLKTMHRLAPEAWLSYATYTGYTGEMMKTPPKFLSMIPEYAICQWTLTGLARKWPADVRPMAKHNIGYLHWCNTSTHTEDDFYLWRVRDICRQAAGAGCEGLDTYGEVSDERVNAEIFYLAWEAFLWDPEMTVERFVDERLGRLYGGAEAARALLEIIPLVRTRGDRAVPEKCGKARAIAAAARAKSDASGHVRWDRLIGELERHERAAREAIEARRREQAAAREGQLVPVLSVRASDEEAGAKNWTASKAIDGSVEEPGGYWLTRHVHPKAAWIELTLTEPTKVNRVAVFHQLNAGHYRSRDYAISVRVEGQWRQVASVRGNKRAGWVGHLFEGVVTDGVRLDITRSEHGNRMGVGEVEARTVGGGDR
ncbi:MAG: discoidin domain-containing protein [Phycisphaerae bacterium]|nr:discoidin domain-containing protein [Phycisphaerae bacterium]